MFTMLIKLRFIGLLLILLFNTSIFGQNYQSMSLQELNEDLTYWNNVVDKGDWWFFRRMIGSIDRAPAFLANVKGLRIWMRETYGKDYFYFDSNNELSVKFSSMAYDKNRPFDVIKWEVLRELQAMHQFSDDMKTWHRNNTIPAIENAIINHPDNQYNPIYSLEPTSAQSCHSRGKGSFWVGTGSLQYYCSYFGTGQLSSETPYVDKKKHGTKISYYKNGNPKAKTDYWNDKLTKGRWFKETGKMFSCINYDGNKNLGSCM